MAIAAEKVVAVLLAAGRSSRFGSDKLAHPFRDKPLAAHAAETLGGVPFLRHLAVIGVSAFDFAGCGFETVHAPPEAAMSVSLRTGVAAAATTACDACLIALADMPLVPVQHFCDLLAACRGGITATMLGARRMVPAIIPRADFERIAALRGDEGARGLLATAEGVPAAAHWLRDVDTPADLAALDH